MGAVDEGALDSGQPSRVAEHDRAAVTNSVVNSSVDGLLIQAGHIDTVNFHVSVRPSWPVPQQLIQDTVDFVGRDEELRALDDLIAADGAPCVAISAMDGIPGVGKTALAVHWAHRVARQFPDGQFFVNMRGHDPDHAPIDPGDALGQLLRSLDVPADRIPFDASERATLYRSLMADRRMLVLLDNVRTAEQVRPLLPGGRRSLVLVTSRNRLSGLRARDGAILVTLVVFTVHEAVDLLIKRLGRDRVQQEPDAAAELVRLCGRLPLALRIAAERCAGAVHARLADLVAEFADERSRLDALVTDDEDVSVRAIFSSSYRALPPETARAFRLLSWHPGPEFSRAAAVALTGDNGGTVDRALRELVRAHLLNQVAADRFEFHDLLRDYARERAEAEDTRQALHDAVRRVLSWYLHSTAAASQVITPARRQAPLPSLETGVTPQRFSSYRQALDWLDSEQANLVGAIPFAAEARQHAIAWQLSFVLSAYFDLRKHRSLWIDSHRTGLASARAAGDTFGEAHLLIDMGLAYRNLKQFNEAITCQQSAIEACRALGDRAGEAQTLAGLGDSYRSMGRFAEAVSAERQALATSNQLGDGYTEAWALTILGQIHREMGQTEDAIRYHEQAAVLHRVVADRYGEGFTLANMGAAYLENGQLDEAAARASEAAEIAREVGDDWGTARNLTNLGQIMVDNGDLAEARRYWTEAAELFASTDEALARDVTARIDGLSTGNLGPRTVL